MYAKITLGDTVYMEEVMYQVIIADDEALIRAGLLMLGINLKQKNLISPSVTQSLYTRIMNLMAECF